MKGVLAGLVDGGKVLRCWCWFVAKKPEKSQGEGFSLQHNIDQADVRAMLRSVGGSPGTSFSRATSLVIMHVIGHKGILSSNDW